jgi:hypothetical protein
MAKQACYDEATGLAALGICESLLIALSERKIISEQEMRDLLTDVAATHSQAALHARAPERHQAVVEIIQRILAGKDAVPLGGNAQAGAEAPPADAALAQSRRVSITTPGACSDQS